MIVFGLDIEDTEYAYRMDGPHDPARGLYMSTNTYYHGPERLGRPAPPRLLPRARGARRL